MPTDEQLIAAMFSFPVWKGATVFEMCKTLGLEPDISPIVSQESHERSPQVLLCAQMQRLFVGCACPDFGATAFFIKNTQLQIVHTPLDPRPSDMAELARLVAVELQSRAIPSTHCARNWPVVYVVRLYGSYADPQTMFFPYTLANSAFDNLGPAAIATEIQQYEAQYIQEWANNK